MSKFRSPMLASDYDPEKIVFPIYASPKIDGIRAVIEKIDENMCAPYARSGKPIRNKHIQECLGMAASVGMDGELVVGDPNAKDVYAKTFSGVMTEEGEPDFTFWVFDLRSAQCDSAEMNYVGRLGLLKFFFDELHIPNARILEQKLINNMEDLNNYEAECLEKGYEGIMIRDPFAKYKYGRSRPRNRDRGGELLKIKRTVDDDAEIIGFVEKMHNDNDPFIDELGRTKRSTSKDGLVNADTLGAFECINKNKWDLPFNVSTGSLTHEECKVLWDNRVELLGKILKFKHLPHGAKDRPRHARFVFFRDKDDIS